MRTSSVPHIRLDDRGTAWIDDTNVKVVEVVLDKHAHGSTPEEMALEFPHLTLAQIYAALAYYHDHADELDAQMERDRSEITSLRKTAPETPGRTRLRRLGRLP